MVGTAGATRDIVRLEAGPEPQAGDPLAEGWQTEAFSEQAMVQLVRIGELLEQASDPAADAMQTVVSSEFTAQPAVPAVFPIIHETPTVLVRRVVASSDELEAGKLRDPAEFLAGLRREFRGLEHLKSKFKLFRISAEANEIVTTQYVHLAGYRASQAREYNATWRIGWQAAPAPQPPRIAWIRVEDVEQVTVRIDQQPWLVDCTASMFERESTAAQLLRSGIDHWMVRLEQSRGVYNFGFHGLAVADVNGDLLDDLYVCQTGGLPNQLFLQQPDGTLRDVSAAAGVDFLDSTRSALLVDLDNDGDQDLILALATGLLLLENDGNARFRQRARISRVRQAFSLAAADYDLDGDLDFYVCVYYGQNDGADDLPLPLPYFNATNGGANYLIANQGNWRFTDVTDQVGLDEDNRRYSFAAAWEDEDRDGDLDLLVVNDFGPNHLYRNEGGRFRNVANQNGLLDGAFGMSATWGDFDRDGRFDIYVSNMFSAAGNRITFQSRFKPDTDAATRARFQYLARGNSLFQNRGDGTYADVSEAQRVTMGRWSWGSLFADVNNDGWEDLLVTNGFITGAKTDDL